MKEKNVDKIEKDDEIIEVQYNKYHSHTFTLLHTLLLGYKSILDINVPVFEYLQIKLKKNNCFSIFFFLRTNMREAHTYLLNHHSIVSPFSFLSLVKFQN